MVQNIVIEPVIDQDITPVIDGVERPVVTQFFGAKHQHSVVSEFIIFDHRQRLKSLSEPHTVSDDTTVVFFQLVYSTEHAIFLKIVKLIPDDRLFKPCFGAYDLLFIQFTEKIFKNIIERQKVDKLRRVVGIKQLQF